MTAETLAAALLRDVPRINGDRHFLVSDVLAALSRALDPAIAERAGDVLEGVSDAPWRVGHLESYEMSGLAFRRVYFPTASEGEIREAHIRGEDCDENARFIAWTREGVPALLAQNAALRARIEAMDAQYVEILGHAKAQKDRAEAAEALVEKLREKIAAEARRYANIYDEGTDGRNTFTIFAEWVETRAALSATATAEGRT